MIVASLLLAAMSLVHVSAAVVLWRKLQEAQRELVRVVALSVTPARIVAEVAPSVHEKTEQQTEAEKQAAKSRRALWQA